MAPMSYTRPRRNHLELARRILEIARAGGLQAGARLPEQYLADQCNVSRTPVRMALKLLTDQGFAVHAADGGYWLASGFADAALLADPAADAPEAALPGRILRDRAARRLEETISISEVMRRYEVTRAEALRALERLAEDALISRAPGQAWIFSPLPDAPESQADSLEFRLILEPLAIGDDAFQLDRDRAAALRRAMVSFLARPDDHLDARVFQQLDTGFHDLIARGAANRFVSEALLSHLRLREVPGVRQRTSAVRTRQAMEEHLGILDHLESGRLAVAADLLRVHLRLSRNPRPQAANRGAPPLYGMTGRPGQSE